MLHLKKGVELLGEEMGSGEKVTRQKFYQIRLRCWLNKGDPVRWEKPWGLMDRALLLENGEVLITDVRIDREFLIPGLFYGVEGMKIGGKRKIKVSPHLAYGEKGIAGIIPERAGARTSQWKTCYDSLRERGLTTTAASVAIARKMARLAFALMRDQTEYQPKYGERTCLFT